MCWFGSNGSSIVAYCGGGGSAKTGVFNKIIVQFLAEEEEITINTGDDVCVGVQVYEDPISKQVWLLGAIGNKVQRYRLPECTEAGSIDVGNGTNALGVHAMGQVFAVGCEDGSIHVVQMTPSDTDPWKKLFVCEGHVKAVCAVQFALRSDYIVSSAKDGMARVWKSGGECIAELVCDIVDYKAPKPKKAPKNKKPPQVLVRGCAFGDLEGKVIYTIASGRKGKAFLSRWLQQPDKKFKCEIRTEIHNYPVSAMNLSGDAGLLALGGVDGTILLVDVGKWKVMKKFMELHELPVTCIAARPFSTPLKGDGEVPFHAISASADSQMGLLTLEKRVPRKPKAAGELNSSKPFAPFSWLALLFYYPLMIIFYFIITDAMINCSDDWSVGCLYRTVLIAPTSRPGITVVPY
jgi:hypothetical protein